jgi:hypothetical protein
MLPIELPLNTIRGEEEKTEELNSLKRPLRPKKDNKVKRKKKKQVILEEP